MENDGHVFVVGADLTRLSCDDVIVPTDRELRVAPSWRPAIPDSLVSGEGPEGLQLGGLEWGSESRVRLAPGDGPRRTWLVDAVDDSREGLRWLLDRTEIALEAVAACSAERPGHGRGRRLVALPAIGTGWGGAAGDRGELLEELLPLLGKAATSHGFDVALVLRDRSDLAAAQHIRRKKDGGWDLPPQLSELAARLGEAARAGQLALFIGAGVGASAGLPTWEGMIEELATRSGLDEEVRRGLESLPAQDSAALLARELGRDQLESYIQERFGAAPYSLAHALVAGLPVQELVTTNYDPLVEMAASDIGRPLSVLPFEEVKPDRPWLLKLHGDATHPHSLVLTRETYLHLGEARAALSGVVDALLLTRHVLFVGTSMLDDDLIRIAHQVRSALQVGDGGGRRRSGTVLALRGDPARARLWEQDVDTVAVAPPDAPVPDAARRLEIFLDLLGCLATPPIGYLLDPAFRGLLDDRERELSDALADLARAVPEDVDPISPTAEVVKVLRRLGIGGRDGQP